MKTIIPRKRWIIIQSGIKEIVYASDKYATSEIFIASRRMLESAGVKLRQIKMINVTLVEEDDVLPLQSSSFRKLSAMRSMRAALAIRR